MGERKILCAGGTACCHFPQEASAFVNAVLDLFYRRNISVRLFHEPWGSWTSIFSDISLSPRYSLSPGTASYAAERAGISPVSPEECFLAETAVCCRRNFIDFRWLSLGGFSRNKVVTLGNMYNFGLIFRKILCIISEYVIIIVSIQE